MAIKLLLVVVVALVLGAAHRVQGAGLSAP